MTVTAHPPHRHLAQLNIATLKAPLESPEMAEFVANLGPVNALAEAAPGFLWRLQTEAGDATALRPFGPELLVNLSLWRDAAALSDFVYHSAHTQFVRRRREWFVPMPGPTQVLWWVRAGHHPTLEEAADRLERLRSSGPTAVAFDFKHLFAPVAHSAA